MYKPTGIIRRIDDLGRVVIPKALRRELGIEEGDPLELCVVDGGVLFTKYKVEEDKE
jgi:AbrB family looped-hinge helix DNA binding protein